MMARVNLSDVQRRAWVTRRKLHGPKGHSRYRYGHPDYDKPLEIVWLCKRCHNELHNGSGPIRVLGHPDAT
jgi:hypothetical protein